MDQVCAGAPRSSAPATTSTCNARAPGRSRKSGSRPSIANLNGARSKVAWRFLHAAGPGESTNPRWLRALRTSKGCGSPSVSRRRRGRWPRAGKVALRDLGSRGDILHQIHAVVRGDASRYQCPSGGAGARAGRAGQGNAGRGGPSGRQGFVRRSEGTALRRDRDSGGACVPCPVGRAIGRAGPCGRHSVCGDAAGACRSSDRSAPRRRGACARWGVRAPSGRPRRDRTRWRSPPARPRASGPCGARRSPSLVATARSARAA
jgi:hypothetical protein